MSKNHDLLKFITCGSVDDGKSTLIGNMLYHANLIFTDQEQALHKKGATEIPYALLLDGLSAEREQGITIDVAYRYFHTEKRSFIVADTPGHEEYTRNMAVGASFATLSILLLDSAKGILAQTRRHLRICGLMGISHFVFAVNKMDKVDYDREIFRQIQEEILEMMSEFTYESLEIIPLSGKCGDNVCEKSSEMPWYQGEALLPYLETVATEKQEKQGDFVLPVQRVSRPHSDFRGFQGQVAQGSLKLGARVQILPSGQWGNVSKLLNGDREVEEIHEKQAVTLCLDRELDCSRGCVLTTKENLPVSRLFRCDLLWMDEEALVVGRNHLLKIGTKTISATVLKICHCVDINSGDFVPVKQGKKNDLIHCDLSLSEKVVFSDFERCPSLGRFLLINRLGNGTSACGVIRHKLSRSDTLFYENTVITPEMRAGLKGQTPKTYWFTGLSGSGKSTLANALEKNLVAEGKHSMLLDGDNVRLGLNQNLGFTEEDRVENVRRIAEVAKLMNQAGLIVLVSVISPFEKDRENAREIIGDGFSLVYVNTSLEECQRRDTKGLYARAMAGEIPNFTGVSSPYEPPFYAEFTIETEKITVAQAVERILGEG